MQLATQSDFYSPSIDFSGKYIDKIPSFNILKSGLRCLCGSRKDKTYETHAMFSNHIKTKTHQAWILNLNENKTNHYIENENLKIIVQEQRLIIARIDKELSQLKDKNKDLIIDNLRRQLLEFRDTNNNGVEDLLDM